MHNNNALGPMLGHTAHLARERMDARLSRYDVTPAQSHVLLYLHERGGSVDQSEMTLFLRVRPSTANGILDRLEEKQLIARTVSDADARRKIVTLTEAGQAQITRFHAAFREAEAVMIRGLDEEQQERLRSLLRKVIQNLEEDRTQC